MSASEVATLNSTADPVAAGPARRSTAAPAPTSTAIYKPTSTAISARSYTAAPERVAPAALSTVSAKPAVHETVRTAILLVLASLAFLTGLTLLVNAFFADLI